MALDDNKISFGVEVSTGQSEESINKIINRIDGLKDKINELKALRKENREDANIFANYTKSIRDTERELSKLQSTYNSWIQKATNVDAKPIGDVKKQAQEFISLLKQWDGQSATFQKQVMSHFMIPNSAVDQLKLYKNIMGELQGIWGKGAIDGLKSSEALFHLTSMAKTAQVAVERLKATLKSTNIDALLRWNGKESFVNEVPGYWDNDSLLKRRKIIKDAYDELLGRFGTDPVSTKTQTALRQLENEYQRLTKEIKDANNALKGTTSDTSGIDKRAKATGKLADEEEKLSRIRQQLNGWDGKGSFSSTIKGFDNLDSYSRQLQALRRAYEELNAVKGKNGIDNTRVESAIDSIKRKYDELATKKSQVDAELKKGTEEVAKASKQAADEESKNTKKVIDEYTKLKLRIADIKEQVKNNYVVNAKTNPELYATNLHKLSSEYAEVSKMAKRAERDMMDLNNITGIWDRGLDRLKLRSAWMTSALIANAGFSLPTAWYEAQTKVENSMAQFAQVMATDAHAVNAFQTSLFDINFSQLEKGFDANATRSQKFVDDLNYMKNSLMNFAIKYGEASEDVIKSATLWGRKYKDNQTVLTMTDAAMKLAVADSFSIVEANKNLESSLVQWGFEIKNNNDAMIVSNKIIDSWTALAHKMALSAQDLSAANQRAAQSMRAVGLSFDEGQALIATMLANTQQAGGEIGNAIKSIIGSIHSAKAIKDIEDMGVAVYKFGENGKKEFREVGQVLVDLMIKTQDTDKNLESLLKNMAGGKFQWNKMGALLDFKTYIQALRLSLTSYGFTQEQVGIQMDTLTRRVEGLKQALISLTTTTGGGFNTALKDAVSIVTQLLQTLNSYDFSTLLILGFMNALVFKGPAVIKMFRNMSAAVMMFGRSLRSANRMVAMSNILMTLLTVGADIVVMTGAFKTATNKAAEEVDKLNKKLETESELYSRQTQAIPIIEQLGEAYRAINEQLEQTQQGTAEYTKLLDEREQVEETLVEVIGRQETETLKAQGVSEAAIESVKQKLQEKTAQELEDIRKVRQQIQQKALQAINAGEAECKELDKISDSYVMLFFKIMSLKYPLAAVYIAVDALAAAFDDAAASILDAINEIDVALANSPLGKLLGIKGDLGLQARSWFLERAEKHRNNIAGNIESVKESIMEEATQTASQLMGSVKNIGGTSSSYDPDALRQQVTGGAGVDEDDDGSGTSKKGKKGSSSREGKPSYDGIELKEVNEDNYHVERGVTFDLTSDTLAKLRALDEAVYTKFGEHVNVSSAYRPGDDDSNHGHKVAFDLSGGVMDDPDKRYWVEHLGPYLGLFVIPEYAGEAGAKFAQGDNVHFSNVNPGIYGETRWAEGLWSEDNAAPTLGTILGKGIDSGKSEYVDNSVQRKVYDFLYNELGLTDKQAWAVMANIDHESAGWQVDAEEDPDSTETGIGLMQWTGQRRHNLEQFAADRGTSWKDLKTQLEFIKSEYNGEESEAWQRFKNFVTDSTTPEEDVAYFAGPNGLERAGVINLASRMAHYYDYDSHYAKGMSFYDSNPSKQKKKEITPEERAEKEAQRLQQMFSAIDKSLDLLSKSFSGKFKTILESVQEDQKYFGSNVENTTKQLNTYSQQLKSVVYMQNQYQQAMTKVSTFLDDKGVKSVLGVSKDEFLKADLSEQQKMMSKQATGKIYQPIIVALNEVMKLKQEIQKQDEEYHKAQLQWVDTYRKRLKNLYEDTIWSEQASIKEWEIRHSNEKYDEWYKYFAEQSHLEAIARQYREEYEEAQKPLLDENGHQVYDSEGNPLNKIENDPKKLEELREKWLSAEEAAKKYSATLKNSVQDSFHDLTKSVLLEGGSLRDKLKELWKGLADDALSLLLSGGKSGTNSPLGNLLRMFMLRHQKQNVQFYDKQHFDYGSQAMWDTSAEQFGAYDFRPQRNYWRQFMGQAKYLYYNPMPIDMLHPEAVDEGSGAYKGNYKGFKAVDLVAAATKFDGKPFNPLNPVPVTIVNGGPLQDALTDIPNTLTNQPTTPSGAFDYGQLGSFNGGIVGQKASNFFANATRYNWMGQFGSFGGFGSMGWGAMPIGQKLGMFTGWLPWLFGLFGHHAEGGEVDKEQISYLAEGNKKEYVIPTETNRPRGVALWQKAGKDLGVLKDGSPVEPNFKNKEIAQNGIMSVQVKQQAIYMEQMKQQNKTLLNILATLANNQQEASGNNEVLQPIVLKQAMTVDEFSELANKTSRYGYNR